MSKPKSESIPLLIQDRLRAGEHFLKLANEFDLEVQQHSHHKHLVWFGLGSGDIQEPLVQQCRGLILDSTDNWNVVARPLDHIFEWDAPGAPLLHGRIRTFDKVDGIMVYMWYYDGWYLGSRANADASDAAPGGGILSNIFWSTFQDTKGYRLPPSTYDKHTFIWELTGPGLSPVVIDASNERRLTLIAVRENSTGLEIDPELFCEQQIRPYACPWEDTIDEFQSFKSALETVISTSLPFLEGVVLRDESNQRIIVTHPEYETARALRKQLSVKWIINNARAKNPVSHTTLSNYGADNWLDLHKLVSIGYIDLIRRITETRAKLAKVIVPTEYATEAAVYPYGDVLLSLFNRKHVYVADALRELPYDELLDMLEITPEQRKAS